MKQSRKPSKPTKTERKAADARDRETSTQYRTAGGVITATRHAACEGKGCVECQGWGFTTSSTGA